jgi:F0F1-type ATP synthase membrane subunit b/b'
MTPRKSIAAVMFVLPLFVFMSADGGARASATMDFVGKAVNFLILFGGLAFVLRKPLAAMLGKRAYDIRETIRLVDASKAEAEKKHQEAERGIAGLAEEIQRMTETAQAVAQREKERLARLAAEEASRIRNYTEQEIEQQLRGGLHELKAYAAERGTSLARERIRKKLTPTDQAALIDKSIERLSRFYEKSGPR